MRAVGRMSILRAAILTLPSTSPPIRTDAAATFSSRPIRPAAVTGPAASHARASPFASDNGGAARCANVVPDACAQVHRPSRHGGVTPDELADVDCAARGDEVPFAIAGTAPRHPRPDAVAV